MYREATAALLRGDENCGRADVDDDDPDVSRVLRETNLTRERCSLSAPSSRARLKLPFVVVIVVAAAKDNALQIDPEGENLSHRPPSRDRAAFLFSPSLSLSLSLGLMIFPIISIPRRLYHPARFSAPLSDTKKFRSSEPLRKLRRWGEKGRTFPSPFCRGLRWRWR